MVTTKKRLLSIMLSLAVMLSFIPLLGSTAYAADYAIYVGETLITSNNASDVFGDGKVSFDRDNLVLTLKNFSYKGPGNNYCGINANYEGLTIQIEGVNTIECTAEESTGIYNGKSMTIKGSGTLNAIGMTNGINSHDAVITIESGTVNASAYDPNDYLNQTGIICYNGDIVISGGTVTASATGDKDEYNDGIYCNTLTVTGGKLIAAGYGMAIEANVKNAIEGVGWTDVKGTQDKTVIPVSAEGQTFKYKKVQFPDDPAPTPAPAKKVTTVTVNAKTISAKTLESAVKKAGGKVGTVKTITLGSKVKKIAAKSFKNFKAAKTLVLKTKKLKKKSVKGSLKGSKITKIKVQVGSKKVNKKYVKKYKKIFTKKNAGKKVKVTI